MADVLREVPEEQPEEDENAKPAGEAESGPVAKAFAFLLLAGVLALVGIVLYRVYPADVHEKSNPGFIDNVFGSNLVVFASRVILLSAGCVLAVAAVFIVISFWKRAKAGHWMSKFGPLETQAVEDLRGLVEQWQGWWSEENARATELEERVAQSDELLIDLNARYQTALVEIQRLQGIEEDQ